MLHKLLEQINALKCEDERMYNILAYTVDVWALARKRWMSFNPGFEAFEKIIEKALKRFLAESAKNKTDTDSKRPPFLR